MADEPRDPPIAIVGGGLGGLALAIGLLKHNIRVHIYEAAAEYAEIGAGVSFGYNAVAALRCIHPQLLKGFQKHATFDAADDCRSTFIHMAWGMDEQGLGTHKAGDPIWCLKDVWHPERALQLGVSARSSVHRARLLEELVALIPEGVTTFRKSFQHLQELDDGRLLLHFKDGTSAMARALVGCDGIKSKVRGVVCGPDVQVRYAGEWAYRALVPKAAAEAALGSAAALNGHIYVGYGGYIVTYPVENGEYINVNALLRDPVDAQDGGHDEWTLPITTEEISCRFQGWYPPLVQLLRQFHLGSKWALFFLQHDQPYYRGRVCLLGDSAHATTPHLGAGAGMAMEDAYILSSLIASLDSLEDIELAFHAYDEIRRPRTQGVIERSVDCGIKSSFRHPHVQDNTVLLRQHVEEAYRWLWHEDFETDLQRAKGWLQRQERPS